ncbi:MAG: hypothetical protein M3352_10590 [Bacteroidota bacterium]|nr:hypothetical protein [Bacteroidota bacterium]
MAQKMINESETSLLLRPNLKNSLLPKREQHLDFAGEKEKEVGLEKATELLMSPVKENNYLPYHLLQKKRKKKKNSVHL